MLGTRNYIFECDKVYLQPKPEYILMLRDVTVSNNFKFSFNNTKLS